jgi:hypothetical protein
MALLGFDGFDHYNSAADLGARNGFIQYNQGASLSIQPGRNGYAYSIEVTSNLTVTFGQRVASAFVGFAYKVTTGGGAQSFYFYDSVAALPQVRVDLNFSNYSVEIYTWVSGVWSAAYISANNVFAGTVWNYVEIWPVISSSAGSVQVKINGQQVAFVSGINTEHSTNAWWDQLVFPGGQAAFYLDDLYYADATTGPGTYPCSSPLGDVRTVTLFPISNHSVTWTPLANTNWQEISEVAMDSDTTYNYTTTVGDEDLFNFGALSSTISKILGVQVTGAYRKDDAGAHTLKQALKSGTTEQYGTTRSLPDTTYSYFTDLWAVDPNTSASWTVTGVDNIAAGYNLVS